jgi:hypothetical protein
MIDEKFRVGNFNLYVKILDYSRMISNINAMTLFEALKRDRIFISWVLKVYCYRNKGG